MTDTARNWPRKSGTTSRWRSRRSSPASSSSRKSMRSRDCSCSRGLPGSRSTLPSLRLRSSTSTSAMATQMKTPVGDADSGTAAIGTCCACFTLTTCSRSETATQYNVRLGQCPESQLRAPPRVLERPACATGAVEPVELRHVFVRERELEDLRVLGDSLAVGGLRDDRDLALEAPAEEHLSRSSSETSRNPPGGLAREVAAASQGAVGLERDPVLTTCVQELLAVLVRAELHLVHAGRHARAGQQRFDLGDAVVGDADRPRVAELTCSLHSGPRPARAALGPVDDVEVEVVDAELLEAARGLLDRVSVPGVELGRDEHLVARDLGLAEALPDAFLVAVGLSGVDMSIAELERPANGVHAFAALRYLPDAEPEKWNLVAIGEDPRPPIGCHFRGRHCALLTVFRGSRLRGNTHGCGR